MAAKLSPFLYVQSYILAKKVLPNNVFLPLMTSGA